MEQSLPGPALQPCVPVAELQHKGPNLLLTRLRLRPTHAPAPAAAAAAAILRCRGLPSRTLSSPFSDPEASQRLSGLMASLTTPVVCPFMVCTHALARMSHTLTLQSMDPEASSLPKGLYCTTRQLLRCWDSERSTGGGGGKGRWESEQRGQEGRRGCSQRGAGSEERVRGAGACSASAAATAAGTTAAYATWGCDHRVGTMQQACGGAPVSILLGLAAVAAASPL